MTTYQDIYPSQPLLRSRDHVRPRAADVLNLEYFEAEPDTMPTEIFTQHHILFNLRDGHRVENWRDGEHRDFIFEHEEFCLTPAGVRSGWRWHDRSTCIVITLEPLQLDRFAKSEVGLLLEADQLQNIPQRHDPDLTSAARVLQEALLERRTGYEVMYESLARVFLIKLLRAYGLQRDEARDFPAGFTAEQYARVLEFIETSYSRRIAIADISRQAGLSAAHFSRLFKQTVGETPYKFLMIYRVERAQEMLVDLARPMVDIALACGFSDQAHFSKTFSRIVGMPPSVFRKVKLDH